MKYDMSATTFISTVVKITTFAVNKVINIADICYHMIHSFIFSPSGTTAKVANIFTKYLGDETEIYDFTVKELGSIEFMSESDIAVFAMPVYAGRIPELAAKRLRSVRGNGQKAVVIVVYGNRDYDDALLELGDIVTACGFKVIAAGAFIAQHCIFPSVATERPDAGDEEKLYAFAEVVNHTIADGGLLDLNAIKGNRPYKKVSKVPLLPKVDGDKCIDCGRCVTQCPTGAIDMKNPKLTDGEKCMMCCRCINVCPHNARHIGGLLYKIAGWKFVRDNSRRLEPEWFV